MKRYPSSTPRPPRQRMDSTPIFYRPTWEDAYDLRARTSSFQKPQDDSADRPAGPDDRPETAASMVNFSTAAHRATAKYTESDPMPAITSISIYCVHEIAQSITTARTVILGGTAEALRAQANLSQKSTTYLLH